MLLFKAFFFWLYQSYPKFCWWSLVDVNLILSFAGHVTCPLSGGKCQVSSCSSAHVLFVLFASATCSFWLTKNIYSIPWYILDISSNPLTVTLGIVSFWERLPDIHCYDYRDAARQLKKLFVLADGSVTHAVLASDWENTWQIGDSLEPRGFHQQTTGSSHEKCGLNWQTWRFNFIYLYLIFNRWKQRNNENQNMGMMINPWNSGA